MNYTIKSYKTYETFSTLIFLFLSQTRANALFKSFFNTVASGCFWGFSKKIPKRTWLCTVISPLLFGLRTWSKRQVF